MSDSEKAKDIKWDSRYIELLPIGVGFFRYTGDDYQLVYMNQNMQLMTGKDGDEMARSLSMDAPDFLSREDAERLSLLLYKAAVIGGSFRDTERILDGSGNAVWTDINISGEAEQNGTSMVCLLMTEAGSRIEWQKKVDHTYSELLGFMNNTPGGIIVFDTINNRALLQSYMSQSMNRLLKGSVSEIEARYGQNPYECIHPEDREKAIRTVEDALRNLSSFQLTLRLLTLQGDYIWTSVNGRVDINGSERQLYLSLIDCSEDTESMHIQKQILDSFARRQYDHICFIDGRHNSYKLLSSKAGSGEFLPAEGTDFEGSMQHLIRVRVVPEEQKGMLAEMTLQNLLDKLENSIDLEYYCTMTDDAGNIHYYKFWVSWIDKETRSISLISSDITEEHIRTAERRRALAVALRAAQQANAAKTEFLSRMSHDIRTPLNAIIGFTEMSLEEKSLSPEVRDNLKKTAASSGFLLSLINDILNMSKIESGKIVLNEEVFRIRDLTDSLSAAIAPQCAEKNLRFAVMTENLHESYTGDFLKLQQVLQNVAGNAVKFTPSGGEISLRIEEIADRLPTTVRFIVKDNGCGMSREFLPHVFESFVQEKRQPEAEAKGTGLGLAICHSLVTLMNGTIRAESEPGKGSVFTIEIPLHAAAEQEEKKQTGAAAESKDAGSRQEMKYTDFAGQHVLLAEDNEMNMEIARHLLERVNLQVDTAKDGLEACECFAASPENHYSAILMDIRMPRMDGLEAAGKIRAMDRSDCMLPIIAMSANAFEEDIHKALNKGINAYTVKPIDTRQFYGTLAKYIKGREHAE